jgi:hypothetical protein
VPEKKFAYEKYTCGKLAATSCSTLAANALQVCSNSVPQSLYFGKGIFKYFLDQKLLMKLLPRGHCLLLDNSPSNHY